MEDLCWTILMALNMFTLIKYEPRLEIVKRDKFR